MSEVARVGIKEHSQTHDDLLNMADSFIKFSITRVRAAKSENIAKYNVGFEKLKLK